jgi:hypothetical protein
MEGGMRGTCYAIEQFQSQWVVSVGGSRVLTCKSKRAALKAARRAMTLLRQSQALAAPNGCRGPATMAQHDQVDGGDQTRF